MSVRNFPKPTPYNRPSGTPHPSTRAQLRALRVLTHGCARVSISRTLALGHRVVTCLGPGLWDGVSSRTLKQGDDKGRILYTELPLSGTCLEISFLYEITSASPVQIPAWKLTLAVPSGGSANGSERMPYL